MISLKPIAEAIRILKPGFFQTLKLLLYYIGACMVLRQFAKLANAKVDAERIGWLVILAVSADRLVDKYRARLGMSFGDKEISVTIEFEDILVMLKSEVRTFLYLFLRSYFILDLSTPAKLKLDEVFRAQRLSERQFHYCNEKELYEIAILKGGITGEFHMLAFKPCDYEELYAAFVVGAFMQLFDDWIDVHQDRREKVRTLFTEGYWTEYDLEKEYRIYRMIITFHGLENYARMLDWIWHRRYFFKFMKRLIDLVG